MTSTTRRPPDEPGNHQETVIPLVVETAAVGKRRVVEGKVRIRTLVETFEENVRGELEGQSVEVSRVPVDREVDAMPLVRTEGDVTIIPVVEEVMVVQKKLVLKEEIHLLRRTTRESVDVPVTLRRERAVVERLSETGQLRDSEDMT